MDGVKDEKQYLCRVFTKKSDLEGEFTKNHYRGGRLLKKGGLNNLQI